MANLLNFKWRCCQRVNRAWLIIAQTQNYFLKSKSALTIILTYQDDTVNLENIGAFEMQQIQPLRLSMNKVCEMLDITREGLRKLMMNDPTFPKALKSGSARQAHVYFDYRDLVQWHESQKLAA